tara:strand:+ start:184 stop:438 length:255 start_codon:yes stop_codon:yes gene_type:complete
MKNFLIIATISAGLIGFTFAVINSFNKTKTYIRDHGCVVIDERFTTYLQPIPQGNGMITLTPMITTEYLYECQIEGKYGTRFWY